jgi:DNA-binding winged helix-turn-helix (wHTH) protein
MSRYSDRVYKFNDFLFDVGTFSLYHRDRLVEPVEKKTLEVLAVLLAKPKRVVSHEEIVDTVWPDDYGATNERVRLYASKLRKLFKSYEPDLEFIRNHKSRGYIFNLDVEILEDRTPSRAAETDREETGRIDPAMLRQRFLYVGAVAAGVLVLVAIGWFWRIPSEADNVKRAVKDSQMFESFVLYEDPASASEADLDKYWLTDQFNDPNYDRHRIWESVEKLRNDGWHYGRESRCDQFDFQSVEVSKEGDMADVKTLEKWFVSIYQADGSLEKNKTIGPYFVRYLLHKVDGRWLIERSTTARVNRPVPRLMSVENESDAAAGKQFFIKLSGQDLEPATVYLEVIGDGCPDSRPCQVPNSALLETAKLSETELDNVPLTLASGNFQIVAHNGDSQASNPVYLKVP